MRIVAIGNVGKRGMALMLVLLAVLFCTMMLTAFLLNNRTYLQLYQRGDLQDQVQNDARSLYEFVRSKTEQSKAWGTPHQNPVTPDISDDLEWVEHGWVSAGDLESRVTGRLPDGLLFRLDILNNLRGTGVQDGVYPKFCRVKISIFEGSGDHSTLLTTPENFSYLGGATSLLHNAAFFDAGIVASEAIELHAANMKFYSKDPVRNLLRSNLDIRLPDIVAAGNDYTVDFAFLNPAGEIYNPRGYDGTLWARGEISLGTQTTQAELDEASRNTNGQFVPHAETSYAIPQLHPDDFTRGSSPPKTLTSGVYVFSEHWVQFGDNPAARAQVPILQQLSSLDDSNDAGTERDLRYDALYIDAANLPPGANPSDIRLVYGNVPDGGGAWAPPVSRAIPAAGAELWDSDGDLTGLTVDIDARVMNVEAGATLDAPGDVVIVASSEYTAVADEDSGPVNPNILYAEQVKLNFGVPDADSGVGRSSIRSAQSINVGGFVQGKGNLIANQDVLMGPNSVDLEGDIQTDLAVYGGRNVVIYPLASTIEDATASFKGLIYAEHNFHFRNESHLEVEGALVARQGHVFLIAGRAEHHPQSNPVWQDIEATEDLKVIYNPDYLDSLLKPTTNERTKVELIAWRPGL